MTTERHIINVKTGNVVYPDPRIWGLSLEDAVAQWNEMKGEERYAIVVSTEKPSITLESTIRP